MKIKEVKYSIKRKNKEKNETSYLFDFLIHSGSWKTQFSK